jgi:ABC transporter substrate binding protein
MIAWTSYPTAVVLVGILTLGTVIDANAWGPKGHRLVGLVARELLTQDADTDIKAVMAADPDPVRSGFVASLAHPGGNITGAKQLELLRETLPSLARVGVLANANSPKTEETTRLEAETRALHLALTESRINRAEQLAPAFAAMRQAGMGAVLFRYDLWFIDPKEVAALVRQHRLPTMHNLRQFVEAGALVSYGVDFAYLPRRVATYVDKLLKGAKAADLPVEQPTKFEFVINLKTAKALGLIDAELGSLWLRKSHRVMIRQGLNRASARWILRRSTFDSVVTVACCALRLEVWWGGHHCDIRAASGDSSWWATSIRRWTNSVAGSGE